MPSRIVIAFKSDFIPMQTLAAAITGLEDMLYDIDREISGKFTVEWGIKELKTRENAIVAVPRLIGKKTQDNSDLIIPAFLNGIKTIRKKAVRPNHFSDEALANVKDLSMAINGDIKKITVTASLNGRLSRPIPLTHDVANHVDEVIGPRYRTIGAVEGRLDMISLRRYLKFGIAHTLTGKTVSCRFFSYTMLEQIKAALGRRVVASGIVHYNAQHEPVRVDVEWFKVLRERHELPGIEDIGGSDPEFTGDLSTEAYLRSIRG
jgi:hypothetical protein